MTATTDLPGHRFLEFVLTNLVEEKDQLKIDGRIDEQGVLLTVQVSDNDMGKVIGKGGQTLNALKVLLRIVGGNTNQRINLKILEPEGSSPPQE